MFSILELTKTSKVDIELPSVNEILKNGFLVINSVTLETNHRIPMAIKTEIMKTYVHFSLTDAVIPSVIAPKYTVSSNGERTGLRNLTIDNAPTIPRDNAIFPEITLVIQKVVIGRKKIVAV